jgi:hypothetical protein
MAEARGWPPPEAALRTPGGRAASIEQLTTNAAARSSSSIGSKETTQAGGPSPAHIASASGSCSGRHSAGAPTVEPGGAWAASAEQPLPSVATHVAVATPSGCAMPVPLGDSSTDPADLSQRLRRLRRPRPRRHRPPVGGTVVLVVAPPRPCEPARSGGPSEWTTARLPEARLPTCLGCLKSRTM